VLRKAGIRWHQPAADLTLQTLSTRLIPTLVISTAL
jgi:hypothetical protein